MPADVPWSMMVVQATLVWIPARFVYLICPLPVSQQDSYNGLSLLCGLACRKPGMLSIKLTSPVTWDHTLDRLRLSGRKIARLLGKDCDKLRGLNPVFAALSRELWAPRAADSSDCLTRVPKRRLK